MPKKIALKMQQDAKKARERELEGETEKTKNSLCVISWRLTNHTLYYITTYDNNNLFSSAKIPERNIMLISLSWHWIEWMVLVLLVSSFALQYNLKGIRKLARKSESWTVSLIFLWRKHDGHGHRVKCIWCVTGFSLVFELQRVCNWQRFCCPGRLH